MDLAQRIRNGIAILGSCILGGAIAKIIMGTAYGDPVVYWVCGGCEEAKEREERERE